MKKNKKLFAILTLVAFMMTLVPALAFAGDTAGNALTVKINDGGNLVLTAADSTIYKTADDGTVADVTAKITAPVAPVKDNVYGAIPATAADFVNNDKITGDVLYTVSADAVTLAGHAKSLADNIAKLNKGDAKTAAEATLKAITDVDLNVTADLTSNITAADTAVKAAAAAVKAQEEFAKTGDVAKGTSGVYVKEGSADARTITAKTDALEFELDLKDANGEPTDEVGESLWVWVERTSENVSDVDYVSLKGENFAVGDDKTAIGGIQITKDEVTNGLVTVWVKSAQAGKVTVKAGFGASAEAAAEDKQLLSANGNVTAEFTPVSSSANKINVTVDNKAYVDGTEVEGKDADSIQYYKVAATILNSADKAIANQKVTISANKTGVEFDETEVTTDNRGKAEFEVRSTKSGSFVLTIVAGNVSQDVKVKFGQTDAVSIAVAKEPSTTIAVDSAAKFQVTVKDVNGNKINSHDNVEIEATAKLGDKKYTIDPDGFNKTTGDLKFAFNPSKVGTYTVTFQLKNNGRKATTTLEVAEQGKITELQVSYPSENVAVGATTDKPEVIEIDAAGVTKTLSTFANIDFAISGNGVKTFAKDGVVTIQNDEKYAGETLVVTAVDKRNNVSGATNLTIADQAQNLAFNGTTAQVGVDTSIPFSIVDSNGNKVALGSNAKIVNATAVATSKPDGANVTAVINNQDDLQNKGVAYLQVASNKAGEAKFQVMITVDVQESKKVAVVSGDEIVYKDAVDTVTKYYTGVANVTFGKEAAAGANSTATMIIGSTTFVANGKVVTSDVAPFVKDGRTFLPIRALGEALGAEVSFDEATNVVTIKLDGKTVTMTLGSAVMTVGDKVVTMDTAAYATAEGRTVVPVRFAAEALGFNVEAVYATDGTTSAVNFSK